MALVLQFQLLFDWQNENNRMYPAFKVDLNQIPIYRLIHHDFEQHYFSMGQLFQSCGLTLTEGFFLFDMNTTDFQVDFEELTFPYCDIWVSMDRARQVAQALGVQDELGLLLSKDLDDCFSVDNLNRNEMMHNWTVPTIPHIQYSTRALLEAHFDRVDIGPKIRTRIVRGRQIGTLKDRTQTGLVRWQVKTYKDFLNVKSDDCSSAVWDVLQGLLFDLQNINREGVIRERVLPDSMMIGNMPLKRGFLNGSLVLQHIYTTVMLEKMLYELNRKDSPPAQSTTTEPKLTVDRHILFHDRLDLFEQELYRLKKKAKKRQEESDSSQGSLQQKLAEFNSWKLNFERKRKSERIWILIFMLTVISAIFVLK